MLKDALRAWIESIQDDLREAREPWISVEERLPEFGDRVDIWLSSGGRVTGVHYFNFINDGDGPHFFDASRRVNHRYELGDASHWMPLPTPPKEAK